MYVKNATNINQQFRAAGGKFIIKPGETVSMTDDEIADHSVQLLIARNVLELLDDKVGLDNLVVQAEERQAKADESRLEVNRAGEDTVKRMMVVRCAAQKENGDSCMANVRVDMGSYDENTPYFCPRHQHENPGDYERVNGAWVMKATAAKVQDV